MLIVKNSVLQEKSNFFKYNKIIYLEINPRELKFTKQRIITHVTQKDTTLIGIYLHKPLKHFPLKDGYFHCCINKINNGRLQFPNIIHRVRWRLKVVCPYLLAE